MSTPSTEAVSPSPENTPAPKIPSQLPIKRINVAVEETTDYKVSELNAITGVTVVSPEIAVVKIKQGNTITITGLKTGETILIVSGDSRRQTLIVEIGGRNPALKKATDNQASVRSEAPKLTGSYNITYIDGYDGSPSLVKNDIHIQHKLSKDKTLRIAGEVFNQIGKTAPDRSLVNLPEFGFNRLMVGIDSPGKTIDFLDSQVNVSPLSFNNFPVRSLR